MASRRKFIKLAGSAIASGNCLSLFHGCSSGIATYRAQVNDGKIRIPLQEIAGAYEEYKPVAIKTDVAGIIFLRRLKDKNWAATRAECTHSGCEVRPLPGGYECPCHGSEYDILGRVVEGPARLPLQRYEVHEDNTSLTLRIL